MTTAAPAVNPLLPVCPGQTDYCLIHVPHPYSEHFPLKLKGIHGARYPIPFLKMETFYGGI